MNKKAQMDELITKILWILLIIALVIGVPLLIKKITTFGA